MSAPTGNGETRCSTSRLGLAVGLLSAAALAYEVLLTRLFTIIQWHHFAYMVISLALLGFGASGTFLVYTQERLRHRFPTAFAVGALGFGLTSVATFCIAQRLPLNPLELFWDPTQPIYVLIVYSLLSIPFFFAATCIGLSFRQFPERIGSTYFADLTGAGLGALGITLLLWWLHPAQALLVVGGIGVASGALVAARLPTRALLVCAGTLLPTFWPTHWVQLQPSPYKPLSLALNIQGAHLLEERSSPLGLLSVVENTTVPLREAPGLSLSNRTEPPLQLGVFVDAAGPTAITHYDGRKGPLAYLDNLPTALPYHLLARPRVLILGAGGGSDVLQSLFHGAAAVTAVEVNPQLVSLVRDDYAGFAGHLYEAPNVRVVISEAREFVEGSHDRFDLIQLALMDAAGAAGAGLYALSESYVYTVEALQAYVERLSPDGMLAITRWLQIPPKETLKLFATALEALERSGVHNPARQLALIRSWRTVTLLVKNGEFNTEETAKIRGFCEARRFDVSYFPGISPEQVNRYNVLPSPELYVGALALSGPDRNKFIKDYKFDIEPATDDRPFFYHFFQWRSLPELLALPARGGLAMLEWGYVMLAVGFAQAVLLSFALILAPLLGRKVVAPARLQRGVVTYFVCLGLAFLFVEIAFIQKFILFLGHPLYAVAAVLAGFLIFSGMGSRYSSSLESRLRGVSPITVASAAIVALAAIYLLVLPSLLAGLAALGDNVKVAVSLLLIAPLAFFMGMPFPLGLTRLARGTPDLVPWAWGINGCASVLAAMLAMGLSIHFGFQWVILAAMALYATAGLVQARLTLPCTARSAERR